MKAADLAAKLERADRQADGSFNVVCPAHNDGRPSCNIKDGDKGLLLHCYAGCEYAAIKDGFIRDGHMEERTEYVPEERITAFSPSYINPRTHIYRDAAGEIKFCVQRLPDKDGGKTFKQYHANGDGSFSPGMKDVARIPYNWHLMHDQPTVFIVEGEQAADAMLNAGYPATTNPGGSSQWQQELTPYFEGKRVIIVPDNDEPGRKHATKIAEALQGVAANTIISPLCRDMQDKADIVDWMQAHPQDISRIYSLTLDGETTSPAGGREFRSLGDMTMQTETNWTIRDLIPGEGMGAVYGAPGTGKTFWVLDAALSIACGKGYKNQQTKHGGVVYFALEGGRLFDNRCLKWCDVHDVSIAGQPFTVSSDPLDLLVKGSDSEVDSIIAGIERMQGEWGQPVKVVVIDTLNRAMAGGNENDSEAMGALVANCDRIWKALGCFLLIVHHSGKDAAKGLRGHSSLLAAVNTEIQLTRLAGTDYSQAEVLKQRDGESGQMHCFSLQSQPVGVDSDGYEVTTCTVVHVDGQEAQDARGTAKTEAKGEPSGKHQRPVYAALKAMLVLDGQNVMPSDGYPFVRCVTDEAFEAVAKGTIDADSGHRSGLFKAAVTGLINAGRINQIGGYTWIT
jgi:5S rRNA maturation endonuclease (ribonuclease M5)